MTRQVVPIILAGGSGTRLWPLSTPEIPKQFLRLVTERTLLQETLVRLEGLSYLSDPIVICNESHGDLAAEQLSEIGKRAASIVLEPQGRNTAPAIAVAAVLAQETSKGDFDPILLVLPADHVIADAKAFGKAVDKAVSAAEAGWLVTFGVVPSHAETGYGYIEQGDEEECCLRVARFVEKPDRETAERYLASGRFLWNSGMFVFGAASFLAELERCAPETNEASRKVTRAVAQIDGFMHLGPEFLDCPSDSVDYAVLEKTGKAAVVGLDAGWSDIGSWAALYDLLPKDADGNVLRGPVSANGCQGSYVHAAAEPVAVIGLDGVVVVAAKAGVLVASRSKAKRVKQVAERIAAASNAKPV